MPFNSNDIQRILLFGSDKVHGAIVDPHSWMVFTGANLSTDDAKLVSVHEYYHWYFNNCTGYGAVMIPVLAAYRKT